MSRKRSQLSLVRELLGDGEAHTHHELYALSCVVHSRVAELRKLLRREELERDRHADQQLVESWNPVLHWSDTDVRSGEAAHWYRLVPLWEFAREQNVSPAAVAAAVGDEAGPDDARAAGLQPRTMGGLHPPEPAHSPLSDEVPIDVAEQLLLEREYEGLRELGEAAA